TLPVRLVVERATNPFLRAPDVATLARLRKEKDRF
ncbi:hydroxyacylglutathione hydrolase C-terminal domain-containing protein, partial [Komagataeibacter kakiaceti]